MCSDIEGQGAQGDNGREEFPAPTKPGNDSESNHLFDVVVEAIRFCFLEQAKLCYFLGFFESKERELTVNPANNYGFPETVEQQADARCSVKVKQLEHIHAALKDLKTILVILV